MSQRVDRFGAVASTLCAAHCAVAALLPVAFSALGLSFLVGHEAEWIFTLLAVGFALAALVVSWRQHRSLKVAALLSLGIIGLLASRGLEMNSGHHGHHEESHHAAEAHQKEAAHKPDEHHEAHEKDSHDEHHEAHGKESHGENEGFGHAAGTLVGVLGGLLLLGGHVSNLRLGRRPPEDCCE